MRSLARAFVAGTVTTAAVWAVVLLGWGLADWRALVDSPARAVGLVVLSPYLFVQVTLGANLRLRVRTESRSQSIVPIVVMFGCVLLLYVAPWIDRGGRVPALLLGEAARPTGLAIEIVGLALLAAGPLTLRRYFSPRIAVQEDHRLVESGIYRWIRHPFYLGFLLLGASFPLVFRTWLGLAIVPPALAVLVWRMNTEERLLAQAFGAEYEAYRRRSWRLVPFLY